MQFNKTLPILIMSMLFFCSFSPAPESTLRVPVTGDLYFINNTTQSVSAAIFQTSTSTRIYTNIAPGNSIGDAITFQNTGDNFTYIITFTTPTVQDYTVTTQIGIPTSVQVIPAGVTAFTFTTPIPGPVGGILVFLDPK